MNLIILSDLPVELQEEAFFGFESYSDTLTAAILAAQTPITFGIFGGWGTGKTSLMRLVLNQIREQEKTQNVFSIWFDAWRFENESNVITPLLYTIRDEILVRHPKRYSEHALLRLANFLDVFIRSLASGFEVGLVGSGASLKYSADDSLKMAQDLRSKKKVVNLGKSLYYDMIYYLRETILHDLGDIRLIIFIDDLDRCQPSKVSQVMETIKLIMDIPGLVFVVGADRKILETSVGKIFQPIEQIDGSAFIKKLIQVFFTLPGLRQEDVQRFVEHQLKNVGDPSIDKVGKIISQGAGANPREIKRLVNNYVLMRNLGSQAMHAPHIALFLVLQQKWPLVYQSLEANKTDFLGFCKWYSDQKNKPENFPDYLVSPEASRLSLTAEVLEFFVRSEVELEFSEAGDLEEYFNYVSIASNRLLFPDEFQFTYSYNVEESERGGERLYRWRIWPVATASVLHRIEKITYRLPADTYLIAERVTTRENQFSLTETSYLNLMLHIEVHLKSGEIIEYSHGLDFGVK